MKEQNNELKPCPFCGGAAKYIKIGWLKGTPSEFANWVMIICEKCLCTTDAYESIKELTQLWNKRSPIGEYHNLLAPCPHCGGKAQLSMITHGMYKAECASYDNYECCHTGIGVSPVKEAVIWLWNKRSTRVEQEGEA